LNVSEKHSVEEAGCSGPGGQDLHGLYLGETGAGNFVYFGFQGRDNSASFTPLELVGDGVQFGGNCLADIGVSASSEQ